MAGVPVVGGLVPRCGEGCGVRGAGGEKVAVN